jgi:predicted nucleic acid-binding Zn ribbon protein
MRKSNEQTLKEVIAEFIKTFHIEDKINETHLKSSWEKIMGKVISKHTVNLYIKDKELVITLDSPALRQELSFAKKKMIKLLNAEFGTKIVEDIVIR